MSPKDKVILILTGGLVFLLIFIVAADFSTALRAGRPPDTGVVELLKMAITGVVGIIAGYLAGRGEDKKDESQTDKFIDDKDKTE